MAVLHLGLLAASLWDRLTGVAAALLATLFGPAVYFDGELVSASLELALAALALWLLVEGEKRRSAAWLAAAGLALAAGAVTRPTVIPFAILAAVWLLWRCASPRAVGLFAAAVISLPAAATVRNAVVAHDPVFIASQGGINFYIGNHARADGTTPNVPGLGSGVTATYEAPVLEASRLAGRPLRASEASAFWFSQGFQFWRDYPREAVVLYAKKVAMVWNRRELPNTQDQAFAPFPRGCFADRGSGFASSRRWRWSWHGSSERAGLLILFAASLTGVTAPSSSVTVSGCRWRHGRAVRGSGRAGCLGWPASRARGRGEGAAIQRRHMLLAGGLFVAAAAFVWLPFPRWQKTEEGMSWFRLATAYEEARDSRHSARSYVMAERAGLETPEFFNNYGLVALREGDLNTAGDRFRRAIGLDPSHGPALANLAETAPGGVVRRRRLHAAAKPILSCAGFLTNAGILCSAPAESTAAALSSAHRPASSRPRALRALGPEQ
jgi:hypothetical protein